MSRRTRRWTLLIWLSDGPAKTCVTRIRERLLHLEDVIHHRLVAHSVTVLRIVLGAVFLVFGVLKYFPGVSPAENLVSATTHLLTFGLVPARASLVAVATLECFIGACLLMGRFMRLAIWLLALQLIGILVPLVLLPGRLFAGPYGAPTLEGQYVLKDVILVGAGMVVAAGTFRGGRLVRSDPSPPSWARTRASRGSASRLGPVLEGAGDPPVSSVTPSRGADRGGEARRAESGGALRGYAGDLLDDAAGRRARR